MTTDPDVADDHPEKNLMHPLSLPTECEWCGQRLRRGWAERIAERGPRSTTGPVYFCDDDCRESWRHHRAGGDE